jgi:anthranilate synthase component 2
MHGKKSLISIDNTCPLFKGLPPQIEAGRYHSLAAQSETVPAVLQVIARDELGEIMAVKHTDFDVFGVQFHPESILTPLGPVILANFLEM